MCAADKAQRLRELPVFCKQDLRSLARLTAGKNQEGVKHLVSGWSRDLLTERMAEDGEN